ncbi:AraC family transcriptional regulator [soil metagenome]
MLNTYDFQVEHPQEFSQLAVKDLLFLYYRCPQVERKINLYTHYNKIIFVLDGKKIVHHREKSWLLTSGQSILLKKTAYKQERFLDTEWEVLCFYIPDHFLKQVFNELRISLPLKELPPSPPEILLEINVSESTRAFFYSIIPYFNQQPPPSKILLELKFKELLFNILSNPANLGVLAYVSSMSDSHKPLLPEIMEANYTFNLSIAEFARISQRSLASFKRDFTSYYKTTPGKWLVQKRLEYAKHLLETSSKNINDITLDCGFENATHFCRVFKEKFGMPPLHYRKNKLVAYIS